MPVAVDVMGGDFGPAPVIKGAIKATKKFKIPVTLVGDINQINKYLKKYRSQKNPLINIKHCNDYIKMEDSPVRAVRNKSDSSIIVSYNLIKDQICSSVVSTGNTGAVMVTGSLILKLMPGINRPAIATLIPKAGPFKHTVLLDSGANVDCRVEQLAQFALMGSAYAEIILDKKDPRVALLSNGSEESKGNDIIRAASTKLKSISNLNYVGFIEGKDIPQDKMDVIVCDGLIGNIVLKTMEGGVKLIFDSLKYLAKKTIRGKIGMLISKPVFKLLFKQKLDPASYGGAPLLGLNGISIVCHGSSNAKAVMNAIKLADRLASNNLEKKMLKSLSAEYNTFNTDLEDNVYNEFSSGFKKNKNKQK